MNLRATLDDLDPLVQASYPATKNVAPFLRKTAKVANDSTPVFSKLADIARLPGQNNDLADTLKKLPTVKKRGGNALPASIKALNVSQDDLTFLRPYTPDIIAWLTKFGEITAYYNGDGHYARVSPAGGQPVRLQHRHRHADRQLHRPPTRRPAAAVPGPELAALRRQPGRATSAAPAPARHPPPDGSNPFVQPGLAGTAV